MGRSYRGEGKRDRYISMAEGRASARSVEAAPSVSTAEGRPATCRQCRAAKAGGCGSARTSSAASTRRSLRYIGSAAVHTSHQAEEPPTKRRRLTEGTAAQVGGPPGASAGRGAGAGLQLGGEQEAVDPNSWHAKQMAAMQALLDVSVAGRGGGGPRRRRRRGRGRRRRR
jgi:hypothetical protein